MTFRLWVVSLLLEVALWLIRPRHILGVWTICQKCLGSTVRWTHRNFMACLLMVVLIEATITLVIAILK